ncbi:hypothetical protein H9P43_002307 [Blastocladiella emersonii ATCC 22665]|nr:hypothetical protein H9P43_002307 [Blastocladiella emersonii ATCC 22665]
MTMPLLARSALLTALVVALVATTASPASAAATAKTNPVVKYGRELVRDAAWVCPETHVPVRAFPQFAAENSDFKYTVAWANDSSVATTVPKQFACRRNFEVSGGGRGWGVDPVGAGHFAGQLADVLHKKIGVSPPGRAAAAAQELIDVLATGLFDRASYDPLNPVIPLWTKIDDAPTIIEWAAKRVDKEYFANDTYAGKYPPATLRLNNTLKGFDTLKKFRANVVATAPKLKALAYYPEYVKLLPTLTSLLAEADVSKPVQPYADTVTKFINSIESAWFWPLYPGERIHTYTTTTTTTNATEIDAAKTWLANPEGMFRAYFTADRSSFHSVNCTISDAKLKYSINGATFFEATLGDPNFTHWRVHNMTWVNEKLAATTVEAASLPAIQTAAKNTVAAIQKAIDASPKSLTTKVEFSAKLGAKCYPVLASLYTAETTACVPGKGTKTATSLRDATLEELMNDALAAFAQEDGLDEEALEDTLADFSAADLAALEASEDGAATEEAFSLEDAFEDPAEEFALGEEALEDGLVDFSTAGDAFEGAEDTLEDAFGGLFSMGEDAFAAEDSLDEGLDFIRF